MLRKLLGYIFPRKYQEDVYYYEYEERDLPQGENVGVMSKQEAKNMLERNLLGVEVVTVNEKVDSDEVVNDLLLADADIVFYSHTQTNHQVWAKFEHGSSKRFSYRSDVKRRELEPVIHPKNYYKTDRTHIFPIGYHGSESDYRLLVGWDSHQNRTGINQFERKVGRYNEKNTILWFVDIERQADGSAIWRSKVWNEEGKQIFVQQWHDRKKYVWR